MNKIDKVYVATNLDNYEQLYNELTHNGFKFFALIKNGDVILFKANVFVAICALFEEGNSNG